MTQKNFFQIFFLSFLIILVSGCSISFGGEEGGTDRDAGVYLSTNQGDTWNHKHLVSSPGGEAQSISRVPVIDLTMDPSDHKAVYLGSAGSGLFYTYNLDNGWTRADTFPGQTVNAVTVHPDSKCIIYASAGNQVFKSTDCNRTWSPVYYDDDPKTRINSIAIDHYNPRVVYIGTTRGDVIKSLDGGGSWQAIHRAKSSIKEVKVSPQDSRILFISTQKDGISRSQDGGENWENFKDKLKEFRNSNRVRDIELCKAQDGLIFIATNYGMLKSEDGGETWSRVELITPEKEAIINAVALNPQNCSQIYYVTNTTFYRSLDMGENWATINLPGSRKSSDLIIDFKKPRVLYLGMGQEPKQTRY